VLVARGSADDALIGLGKLRNALPPRKMLAFLGLALGAIRASPCDPFSSAARNMIARSLYMLDGNRCDDVRLWSDLGEVSPSQS
jgi:hypothetical protein